MSDVREIGSDFELDASAEVPSPGAPWGWVQDPATRRLMSGREALRLLLREARADGRDRLLLPAYLCDSVAQAASADWDLERIPVTDRLVPRADALADAMARAPERTVVVEVPIFSAPLPPAVRQALDSQPTALVIEDLTHTLLSRERPARPHAIASIRKWLPIADGGLAVGSATPVDGAEDAFAEQRAGVMDAKWRWLRDGTGDKDAYLRGYSDWEHALDAGRGVRSMSAGSQARLEGADLAAVAASRRANYRTMRELVLLSPRIGDEVTLFEPDLADGAVPLGLPVICRRRDALRRHLIRNQVYCPVHWPLPRAVAEGDFPMAQRRNRELMTLVIDQRYGPLDMARVATLIEDFART